MDEWFTEDELKTMREVEGWEHGSLGTESIPGTPTWLTFFIGVAVAILFVLMIYVIWAK